MKNILIIGQKSKLAFENLKKIQNVFLNCYFKSKNTKTLFENLTSNEKNQTVHKMDLLIMFVLYVLHKPLIHQLVYFLHFYH